MKEYNFVGDCLEIDIEGISLCDKKIHDASTFHLSIKLGMDVSVKQLKELLKFNEGLNDTQWWKLELKKKDKGE